MVRADSPAGTTLECIYIVSQTRMRCAKLMCAACGSYMCFSYAVKREIAFIGFGSVMGYCGAARQAC